MPETPFVTAAMQAFMDDLGYHDGYAGAFSRAQAQGAYPNGTRIVKVNSEPGDSTKDGTNGTVLGSLVFDGQSLYFIEWDDKPKVAIGTIGEKVSLL